MNLNVLREAIKELEGRRAQIDAVIVGLQRVIEAFVADTAPAIPDAKATNAVEPAKVSFEMTPRQAPTPRQIVTPEAAPDNGELLAWRKKRSLSQTEVGKLFGCSTSMVCRIEQGHRALSPLYRAAMERYDKEHPAKAQVPARQPGPRFPAIP